MAKSETLATRFEVAMDDARNLVVIHGRVREGRGRRHVETVLNRSAVLHSVAAWQVQVEVVAISLLNALASPLHEYKRLEGAMYQLVSASVGGQVDRFNSPNSQNTIRLLAAVGYDVKPSWSWTAGNKRVGPGEAEYELNQWVTVRHQVAHGDALTKSPVISANKTGPTVTLKNAKRCIRFFERLAKATRLGAKDLLPTAPSVPSFSLSPMSGQLIDIDVYGPTPSWALLTAMASDELTASFGPGSVLSYPGQ